VPLLFFCLYLPEVAAPRTPKAEDQSWSSEVGSNINSLGFPPETKYNDKRKSRQEESSSSHGSDAQKVTWLPRPLQAPSCSPHAPHELVMQVSCSFFLSTSLGFLCEKFFHAVKVSFPMQKKKILQMGTNILLPYRLLKDTWAAADPIESICYW